MTPYCADPNCQFEGEHIHASGSTAMAIELAESHKEVTRLREALRNLFSKVKECTPFIDTVTVISSIHGQPYEGPHWVDEMAAAEKALASTVSHIHIQEFLAENERLQAEIVALREALQKAVRLLKHFTAAPEDLPNGHDQVNCVNARCQASALVKQIEALASRDKEQ